MKVDRKVAKHSSTGNSQKSESQKSKLDVSIVDDIDEIQGKLAFLAYVKTGRFATVPGEKATFGEALILTECSMALRRIIGAE